MSFKKFELVENYIKEKIAIGSYPIGTRIPSEDELIEKLKVSRNPVRRALNNLSDEGVIYKIQGSGSYVKNVNIPDPLDIYAILPSESANLEIQIIQGMRKALEDSPYNNIHLILKKPGKNTLEQIEIVNMISQYYRGGILCIPVIAKDRTTNRLLIANLRKMERSGFPVIQVDTIIPEFNGSYIMSDHRKASYKMMQLLSNCNHENIGLIYRNMHKSSIKQRVAGVHDWYKDNPDNAGKLRQINLAENEIITNELVTQLLDQGITAIFGLECELVCDIYLILLEMGLSIPENISLCSFDDHCFTGIKSGFITAVVQRLETIGYYAVQLLLDQIEGKTTGTIEMLIVPDIVKRKSVGRL